MEKYISKAKPQYTIQVKEAKKDTVIKSEAYGPILVTKGNFIMKHLDGNTKGYEAGITQHDLDAHFEPVKK